MGTLNTLFLAIMTATGATPNYRVPEIPTNLPQEDQRLNNVATWAITQGTIPNIIELRWEMSKEGISLEEINALYQVGSDQEQVLKLLKQELPQHDNPSIYHAWGKACTKKNNLWQCVIITAKGFVQHQPFPVSPALNEPLNLRAILPLGYRNPNLWLIRPDGTTVRLHLKKLAQGGLEANVAALKKGIHQLELMADGPTGPKVLLNVPIFWGVHLDTPRPNWLSVDKTILPDLPPDQQLLWLINRSRSEQKLAKLKISDQLSQVARERSRELAQSGVLSHLNGISTPEEHLQQLGIPYNKMAENIAQAADIWSAHYLLLTSPSHRLAILNPNYTHIGLGVAHSPQHNGTGIFVVETFAELKAAQTDQEVIKKILTTLNQNRQNNNLPPLTPKGALLAIAQKEVKELAIKGQLPHGSYEAKASQYKRDYFLISKPEDVTKSANFLANLHEVGIAIAAAQAPVYSGQYWVVIIYK